MESETPLSNLHCLAAYPFMMVFRPVAFLVRPLTPQDETKVPLVALVGLLRGREPGTAPAWWVLTGRAPYRLVVIPSVIMAVNAWCCAPLSNLHCLAAYPFIEKASGENPENKSSLGPVKSLLCFQERSYTRS
jgi:hypothetical protein